ncbi:MAG: ROK family protein [Acidobacteria bacterium]|nr:ROK family protein [Acidobacteriota bacterium]
MRTLAIDIGGTKFSMAVFENDAMVRRASRATDREGGREWMLQQIVTLARDWQRELAFERCGIGFGGPVDFPSQRIALSTHVPGWRDFALAAHIEDALGIPSVMDNDANAGALGEALHGAGAQDAGGPGAGGPGALRAGRTAGDAAAFPGCSPLFYMTLSTGIGGGIIAAGRVWRGADSWAGEIGHLTIRPDGPACLCGARGCFERLCGGLWLERDHGRPARELLEDRGFVARYVVDLALGLKACIMLLNPARIVIGGGISQAGDRLFGPLRAELRRQITGWSGARVDVVPAALGDASVLWGALALAREATVQAR